MRNNKILSVIIALIISTQVLCLPAFSAKTDTQSKTSTSAEKNADAADASKTGKKDTKTESKSDAKTDAKEDDTKTEEKKASFPKPNAKSAIVIDANSGDVIYAFSADKKLPTAGLSNIMTAIVALENGSPNENVEVTEEALKNVKYDQPQLGIKVGEYYTLEQLLYAILLNSDNDAANAIAIHISGNLDDFVAKMNEKAKSLGLSGTHFANPTGLHNSQHYSTAQDLATLARYAMKNSEFREIVKTPKYEFPPTANRGTNTILSTNHMVSRYKYPYHYYNGATGIKSGNSENAGYCLITSVEKNNLSLISVVMGCDNTDAKDGAVSFVDTKNMLDYIFDNYQSVLLTRKGDVVFDSKVSESKHSTRLALTVEDDVYITLKKNVDADIITNEVNIVQDLKAPISQGDYFGTISYFYNGKQIKTANVVAANEVKRDFILHIIGTVTHIIFNPIVLIILIAIIALYVRARIVRNRKRRIRRQRLVSKNGGLKNDAENNVPSSHTSSRYSSHRFDDYSRK